MSIACIRTKGARKSGLMDWWKGDVRRSPTRATTMESDFKKSAHSRATEQRQQPCDAAAPTQLKVPRDGTRKSAGRLFGQERRQNDRTTPLSIFLKTKISSTPAPPLKRGARHANSERFCALPATISAPRGCSLHPLEMAWVRSDADHVVSLVNAAKSGFPVSVSPVPGPLPAPGRLALATHDVHHSVLLVFRAEGGPPVAGLPVARSSDAVWVVAAGAHHVHHAVLLVLGAVRRPQPLESVRGTSHATIFHAARAHNVHHPV